MREAFCLGVEAFCLGAEVARVKAEAGLPHGSDVLSQRSVVFPHR
jgi:hypothetical protein